MIKTKDLRMRFSDGSAIRYDDMRFEAGQSYALLGASGVVFMMIVLSSLAGAQEGRIPLTLILVVIFYIGGEVINGVFQQDNISQMAHIIGGLCGAVIGFILEKGRRRRPAI